MPHVFATKKVLKRKGDPNRQPGKRRHAPTRKIIKRAAPPKPQIKRQVKKPTIRQVRGPAKGPLVTRKGGKPFQLIQEASAFQMPFRSYLAPLVKDGRFVVSKRTGHTKKRGVVYTTETSIKQSNVARGPEQVKDEQSFWRDQKLVTGDLSQGGLRTGSRTHQADTYGRLFKKDKIKQNEFTQIIPGYYAVPENTGFNPARKWIKLKTKKVKTSKKLVAAKAPDIQPPIITKGERKRLLKGTGSGKMDTFFGAGIAAGVGGAWEQFSDAISYNPLPYAAAAVGAGVIKKVLKPNETLDLTDSLKTIWRQGHEGRAKKFKNVNELDKRITYLDKELSAAKSGAKTYDDFTGYSKQPQSKRGTRPIELSWGQQAPSTAEVNQVTGQTKIIPSTKTIGESMISKIELEKMTLETNRLSWDTQKEVVKTGASIPSKITPGYIVQASSPTGTQVVGKADGPASVWYNTAMPGQKAKMKKVKKTKKQEDAELLALAPKTEAFVTGLPEAKTSYAKMAKGQDVKLEESPKPTAPDDISIPGGGTIKSHSIPSGKKGVKKVAKYMGGAALGIVGLSALTEADKVLPWFSQPPPSEQSVPPAPPGGQTLPGEQVAGTEMGASTLQHLENLGVTPPVVLTVEELLAEGNYKGAQDQALANRGLDAEGNALQTTGPTPMPGFKSQMPWEQGLKNTAYKQVQSARWVGTPGGGGSIQSGNQWAKLGMSGVSAAQLETMYMRQAKGQNLNALHAELNGLLNAKGGDLLARAEVAQRFYKKNSGMMGSLPSQYKTILANRARYEK
jgi:hypothetical protein